MHREINPGAFYYGFPVILLSTSDKANHTNITPISSSWSLGKNIVIGLVLGGKALENLKSTGEAVINLVPENLIDNISRIEKLSGKTTPNKFEIAGLTPQESIKVAPKRVLECSLQAEVKVSHITERTEENYAIVEFTVVEFHGQDDVLFDKDRIDPTKWKPLIYNFRHYQGLTETKGKNFKAYS